MKEFPTILLLIETSRGYGRGLLRGIAKYSSLHGPWDMECEVPFYIKPVQKTASRARFEMQRADGIIMREPRNVKPIIDMRIPVIFASYRREEIPDTSRIMTDDNAISKMAAQHFIDRGFKNFAFLGYDNMYWSANRSRFLADCLKRKGFHLHSFRQAASAKKRLWDNEQFIVAQWLKSMPRPFALMSCNDDRARQAVTACRIAGLSVPDDVAVIGVDNDDFVCDLSNPPLSSIDLNTERAGFEAAELLDKMMSSKRTKPQKIIVSPTRVVTRQSSEIYAISDSEVAAAVRFIRENARQAIQVNDVVNAVTLSRRSLYQRFRRLLGRSVHEEIRRARVDEIARLLVETNLSVYEIALRLRFPGVDHIAQYFRKQKGMNPLAYRNKYGHK
jgi:LacI family transcriptional regulator